MMSEHALYEIARQRVDQRNNRRTWWNLNLTGFLIYVGFFVVLATTAFSVIAVAVLLSWIALFVFHTLVLEQSEARDKAIESEVAGLRNAAHRTAEGVMVSESAPALLSTVAPPVGNSIFDGDSQLSPLDALSPREIEVLALLTTGASNDEIAAQLVIAPNTVKRHVKHILAKLHVTNRTQAVHRARQLHLLEQNTP